MSWRLDWPKSAACLAALLPKLALCWHASKPSKKQTNVQAILFHFLQEQTQNSVADFLTKILLSLLMMADMNTYYYFCFKT